MSDPFLVEELNDHFGNNDYCSYEKVDKLDKEYQLRIKNAKLQVTAWKTPIQRVIKYSGKWRLSENGFKMILTPHREVTWSRVHAMIISHEFEEVKEWEAAKDLFESNRFYNDGFKVYNTRALLQCYNPTDESDNSYDIIRTNSVITFYLQHENMKYVYLQTNAKIGIQLHIRLEGKGLMGELIAMRRDNHILTHCISMPPFPMPSNVIYDAENPPLGCTKADANTFISGERNEKKEIFCIFKLHLYIVDLGRKLIQIHTARKDKDGKMIRNSKNREHGIEVDVTHCGDYQFAGLFKCRHNKPIDCLIFSIPGVWNHELPVSDPRTDITCMICLGDVDIKECHRLRKAKPVKGAADAVQVQYLQLAQKHFNPDDELTTWSMFDNEITIVGHCTKHLYHMRCYRTYLHNQMDGDEYDVAKCIGCNQDMGNQIAEMHGKSNTDLIRVTKGFMYFDRKYKKYVCDQL